MSLILEALRKSEAERRRGQAPHLFDPPAATVPATSKPPAHALWWALPVVLSAVLLMLWRYAATSQAVGQVNEGDRSTRVGPTTQPPQVVNGIADAGARMQSPAPAKPVEPATTASPPFTPAPAANPAPLQARSEPAAAPVESAPVERPRPDRSPSATAAAARPEPITAPPPAPVPTMPPAPARAPRPPDAAATRPQQPTQDLPASAEPRTASRADAEPLRLSDLAPVDRRALPPLKMSMHMWSADATQRFVILDGARVGEGDRVGEAVVEEITRDGAVLAWSGRRVKVPVR